MKMDSIKHIVIRKNPFFTNHQWTADIIFNDGNNFKNWAYRYHTRKDLLTHIHYVVPDVDIIYI